MARLHASAYGFLLLMFPALVAGQMRSAVGGPLLGIASDSSGDLRPVLGIAGASLLGKPLQTGIDLAIAAAAPSGEYVVGMGRETGQVVLLEWSGAAPALRAIDAAIPRPDRIVLSAAATAAALYHRDTASVEIVTGLPQAPVVSGAIDVSAIAGSPEVLAASDDGSAVLVAAQGAEAASLFFLTTSGDLRAIFSAPRIAAAAFLFHSLDAVAADPERRQIVLIRNTAGMAETLVLAGPGQGIGRLVAVAASGDNQRVFAADAAGQIASMDIGGENLNLTDCQCEPAGLFRMNRESLFRLNEISSGPLLLFDGAGQARRILFVPADAQDAAAGDGQ